MELPLISLMPVLSIERTKEGNDFGSEGIQSICICFDVAKRKELERPLRRPASPSSAPRRLHPMGA